jgi:hypothetical protein
MTSERDEPAVIAIEPPRVERGQPHCPRCDGRLLFDGAELLCLACGYEYVPPERELSHYRAGPRRALEPALAVAPGFLFGLSLGTVGIVLAAVVGLGLLLRGRLRG